MKLTPGLTDEALLRELGARLERRRIDANLTQAQLALEAGISKRTLERIETGDSTDFVMLIRVLRALKLIEGLENLIPDLPQSPITLLKLRGRERKRAGHPRTRSGRAATHKPAGPWKWGE
ncbi:MAG: helix-turn-helix transcriptional regulator [Gammaproteobacteria bacterium]|nr:MAG: helix-turn-helix transcriptional regulator [Gammaproteobacteria bacterium]TLY85784.1 MAG: helix-turn-helix transcriptional regulator [Gammaproteobacteria bacterium]TLZ02164.1 MAG: helix-turn-helix transcriptional regulator [Gammaproteobacteria bacterium]TLZ09163.1 MAG: helix-turn-helix transcriptional regulator [Gammaproteobacteria bacterium]TLZ09556.1 MAG: helix-turn-helix transcriptional regulator [Gammaproteobacteria bacterium]